MKYTLLAGIASIAVVSAQTPSAPFTFPPRATVGPDGKPLPKCIMTKDIKPLPDPLMQYKGQTANFPCDMGAAIPYGPVPKGCAKFEVIVARGTSEPGEFGSMVGDPVVARVKRDMPGVNVRGYPVQYPADGAAMMGGPKMDPAALAAHSAIGPNDILYRIGNQTKECPDEKFALLGYSQGGMVVYRAAALLKAKPELADKVLAVVFYGANNGSQLVLPASTMLANCARGDMACPEDGKNVATPLGHVSYNDEGTVWHDRTSKFIVSAFNGKPLGPKLMKEATGPL